MTSNSNDETSRQLIVMGNGFDLQCGLNTRYQDFFDYTFGISLQSEINKYLGTGSDARTEFYKKLANKISPYLSSMFNSSIRFIPTDKPDDAFSKKTKLKIQKLDIITETRNFINEYINQIQNQITNKIIDTNTQEKLLKEYKIISSIKTLKSDEDYASPYSKWDTIFLLTNYFLAEDSKIQWNDVENIILTVVSIVLLNEEKEDPLTILSDLAFKPEVNQSDFISSIKNCFDDDKNKIAISMLDELIIFEGNFANYIRKTEDENKDYHKNCFELLTALIHVSPVNTLDILSFNYSLDKGCINNFTNYFRKKYKNQKILSINSWSNIHGIASYKDYNSKTLQNNKTIDKVVQAPAPIFGIDSHDILNPNKNNNFNFDDPRSIFTKSFRLLDNHVNNIRTKTFQKDADVITFFGHSLNQADYSYFESIFDQYDIFHSNVKLEFYYYQGNDKVTAKKNEREVMKNVVKLLTSYGNTLANEHGENIVNKLILEQRLSVLPNPPINY